MQTNVDFVPRPVKNAHMSESGSDLVGWFSFLFFSIVIRKERHASDKKRRQITRFHTNQIRFSCDPLNFDLHYSLQILKVSSFLSRIMLLLVKAFYNTMSKL